MEPVCLIVRQMLILAYNADVRENGSCDACNCSCNFSLIQNCGRFNDRMAHAMSNQDLDCDFGIFLGGIRQVYDCARNTVCHFIRV